MITFKKIMAGCDFSEYSKQTLEYAASLVEKCQAELIVVNVINQREVDTILKVANRTFDRTVERNVEKLADEYVTRETEKRTQQIDKLIEDIAFGHLSVKKIIRIGL
jgi:nucleotide-binding universal stress UspA family protein